MRIIALSAVPRLIMFMVSGALFVCMASADSSISLNLPIEGTVSLGVYNPTNGVMYREVLRGEAMTAGNHSVHWDGRDKYGYALPPGSYEWRMVQTGGITSRYVMSFPLNPPGNRYDPWPGSHYPASTMARGGGRYIVGSSMTEGAREIVGYRISDGWMDAAQDQTYDGFHPLALGYAHGKTFGLTVTGYLRRYSYSLNVESTTDQRVNGENGCDLDALGTNIVIAYTTNNLIRFVDVDGNQLRQVTVPRPYGVTIKPNGNVLVASGQNIVEVEPGNDTPITRITGLHAPRRLSVDTNSGALFVIDAGDNQQVRTYDANFNLTGVFGRQGGRELGPYVATNFLFDSYSHDIMADDNGNFFVLEVAAPRRMALFNGTDGTLINERYGGIWFYTHVTIDPTDAEECWVECGVGRVLHMALDLDTPGFTLKGVYSLNPRFGANSYNSSPYGQLSVFDRGTHTYLWSSDRLRVYSFSTNKTDLYPLFEMGQDPNQGHLLYIWENANEDGVVDPGELTEYPGLSLASLSPGYIDDDWNVYFPCQYQTNVMAYLPRSGWHATVTNMPTYDLNDFEILNWRYPQEYSETIENHGLAFGPIRDSEGNFIVIGRGRPYESDDRHGAWWLYADHGMDRLLKYTPDGRLLYSVGRHKYEWLTPATEFCKPVKFLGKAHGVIGILDNTGQPHGLFYDESGLFVGTGYDHYVDDGTPSWLYQWWSISDDSLTGALIERDDGKVFWFGAGHNCSTIYQVYGLDTLVRQTGTVVVASAAESVEAAGSGLPVTIFSDSNWGTAVADRIDPYLRFGKIRPAAALEQDWNLPSGVALDDFSVRWEGYVEPPVDDDYIFSMRLTGVARLWVNGIEYLSRTNASGVGEFQTEPISLMGATLAPIRLDYASRTANAPVMQFHWERMEDDREVIGRSWLYRERGGSLFRFK